MKQSVEQYLSKLPGSVRVIVDKYVGDLDEIRLVVEEFGNEACLFRHFRHLIKTGEIGERVFKHLSRINACIRLLGLLDENGKLVVKHAYGACAIGACHLDVRDTELLSATLLSEVVKQFPEVYTSEYLAEITTIGIAHLATGSPENNRSIQELHAWRALYWLAMNTAPHTKVEPNIHSVLEVPSYGAPTMVQ